MTIRKLVLFLGCAIFIALTVFYFRENKWEVRRALEAVAPVTPDKLPTAEPINKTNVATPQSAFAQMSLQDRSAVLMEIKKMDFGSMMQMWINAGRAENDSMKQGAISTIFAFALRERMPPPGIYNQMRDFLLDKSNSNYEQAQLLGVLAQAATKDTVDLLIRIAETLSEPEMKGIANQSIAVVGNGWGDGTYHEELSPILERAWQSSQDVDFFRSIAIAMAEVGASSGIKLLIDASLSQEPQTQSRRIAALYGLRGAPILNPNAIGPFGDILTREPLGSAASNFAGDILSASDAKNAAVVLVDWLRSADDDAAPLARVYVARARTTRAIKTWESALDLKVSFRHEKNREAIRDGLADYYQSRTTE